MTNRELRRYIRKVFKKLGYNNISIDIEPFYSNMIRVVKNKYIVVWASRDYFENLYYKGRFCDE